MATIKYDGLDSNYLPCDGSVPIAIPNDGIALAVSSGEAVKRVNLSGYSKIAVVYEGTTDVSVDYLELMGRQDTTATLEIVEDSTASSGYALKMVGAQTLVFGTRISYVPTILKKVVAKIKADVASPTDNIYVSLQAYANGVPIDETGATGLGYIPTAIDDDQLVNVTRSSAGNALTNTYGTIVGYVKGVGGSATTASPYADEPNALPTGTDEIALTIEIDGGTFYIDIVALEEVENSIRDIPEGNGVYNSVQNFDGRNDRISTPPADPASVTANSYVLNGDGTVDVPVSWDYTGSGYAYNIDGFVIYAYTSDTNDGHTLDADDVVGYVRNNTREYTFHNGVINKYYLFGVQAYRVVDADIDSDELLESAIVASTAYQPVDIGQPSNTTYYAQLNVDGYLGSTSNGNIYVSGFYPNGMLGEIDGKIRYNAGGSDVWLTVPEGLVDCTDFTLTEDTDFLAYLVVDDSADPDEVFCGVYDITTGSIKNDTITAATGDYFIGEVYISYTHSGTTFTVTDITYYEYVKTLAKIIEDQKIYTMRYLSTATDGADFKAKAEELGIENAFEQLAAYDAFITNLFTQEITIASPGFIKSSNYDVGVGGFVINYDGSAEFNDVTVRGTIEAGSASTIPYENITNIPNYPSDEDLVAYYPLDKGSGTIVFDMVGGNDGSINGASWANGISGKALSFDGTDDNVDLPSTIATAIDTDVDFTLSLWVKPDTLDPVDGYVRPLVFYLDGDNFIAIQWQDANNNWYAQFKIGGSADVAVLTAGTGSLNWTHLALSYVASTNVFTIIQNGSLSASGTYTGATTIGITSADIGGQETTANFDGLIDDVRIYDKALTTQEIQALYNNPGNITNVGISPDADNTQTAIDNDIETTAGTITVKGSGQTNVAGMTAEGTDDDSVRLWAGETYANRATAPFRVTQNGSFQFGNYNATTKTGGIYYDPDEDKLLGNVAYDQWDLVIESDADLAKLYSGSGEGDFAKVLIADSTNYTAGITSGAFTATEQISLAVHNVEIFVGLNSKSSVIHLGYTVGYGNNFIVSDSNLKLMGNFTINTTTNTQSNESFYYIKTVSASASLVNVIINGDTTYKYGRGIYGSAGLTVTNCRVYYVDYGFMYCYYLESCWSYGAGYVGYYNCQLISNSYETSSATYGFYSCDLISNSISTSGSSKVGFYNCNMLSGCNAHDMDTGYSSCNQISASTATLCHIGFSSCSEISGVRASGASQTAVDADICFDSCEKISASYAELGYYGFSECSYVSSSEAYVSGFPNGELFNSCTYVDYDSCNATRTISAGTTEIFKYTTEQSTTSTSYVNVANFKVPISGTFRLTLDVKRGGSTGDYLIVSLFDGAILDDQDMGGTSYTTKTHDLTLDAGDELYLYIKGTSGNAAYINNIGILADNVSSVEKMIWASGFSL